MEAIIQGLQEGRARLFNAFFCLLTHPLIPKTPTSCVYQRAAMLAGAILAIARFSPYCPAGECMKRQLLALCGGGGGKGLGGCVRGGGR